MTLMSLDKRVGQLVILLACAPQSSKSDSAQAAPSLDSLVLERTECFGSCPAYRLRISSAEQVRFESHNRRDSANVATDTAPPGTYAHLVTRAQAIGFYDLPPDIIKDSVFCRVAMTDAPTFVTTIFSKDAVKRVSDYSGCALTTPRTVPPPLQRLRAFENEIDSVLRSSRWIRPNPRR
ncbi:MAG TPA: DUF6438 domain-containing protein [Gemmatimonadaceae bacterium]